MGNRHYDEFLCERVNFILKKLIISLRQTSRVSLPIPFGYILAKAKDIDIRSVGSGNIGATKAMRAVCQRAMETETQFFESTIAEDNLPWELRRDGWAGWL